MLCITSLFLFLEKKTKFLLCVDEIEVKNYFTLDKAHALHFKNFSRVA